MAVVNVANTEYHIDNKLKSKWDKLKDGQLAKMDSDRVYIVDGRERVGKSLWTIQQAAYIDPSIIEGEIPRICFDADEFLKQIRHTKSTKEHTKVVIFDEAFRGLSSRAVMSKTNKKIVQALMEMGQNNLVVFIVLPSFYLLDIYPAMLRSEALIHIYLDKKSKLRSFRVFNYQKKAKLFKDGTKKGWNYKIFSPLAGRCVGKKPGGDEFWNKYLEKKQKSFREVERIDNKGEEESKMSLERKILLVAWYNFLKKAYKIKIKEYLEWLKPLGIEGGETLISEYTRRMKSIGKFVDFERKGDVLVPVYSENTINRYNSQQLKPILTMREGVAGADTYIDRDSEASEAESEEEEAEPGIPEPED